jgi:hypothetical protein
MVTSNGLSVWATSDDANWNACLTRVEQYDFCHLASFHRVAESHGEGVAHLFEYREKDHTVALPLLLRPVPGEYSSSYVDAASVYGYGGPIRSRSIPAPVIQRFQEALTQELRRRNVVSVFSRLHPLIDSTAVLEGLGAIRQEGLTVSIDLSRGEANSRAGYSKSCRRSLRKLRELGFVGVHDAEKKHLAAFAEIYRHTMLRSDATESYRHSEEYFHLLNGELGDTLQLFVVLYQQSVVAGSLVTDCSGILQDFLGGTNADYLRFSPDRLVVDTERMWGVSKGACVHHLGGGRGAQQDSLFAYKAGFSDRRHSFGTWRWIVMGPTYRELVQALTSAQADDADELCPYFPRYRSDGAFASSSQPPSRTPT